MYLIIIGAGTVTKHLILVAQKQGHRIAVIEKQAEPAKEIMRQFDVQIFHADIAEGGILEEADVNNADAIIATTNDDSVNLMAMVLGKQYQVKNLITMLTNKEHRTMFEQLGVRVLSEPEKFIAQQLYQFIQLDSK